MIKIYVNPDLLSFLFMNNNNSLEKKQFTSLIKLSKKSDLKFVISGKMFDKFFEKENEVSLLKSKILFKKLEKIPPLKSENYIGIFDYSIYFYTDQKNETKSKDPLFSLLKSIFDFTVAENVYYAINNKCDYYITVDQSLLEIYNRNREEIKKYDNLKFIDPVSLWTIINGEEVSK